ncbi:protein WVD2-like 7 isoform X2 [Cornus florida]|nr:protein WVD2-like 7 isoform X2 [Cornus florida]
MGESVGSVSTMEVSVSFGRFENESLSWEKWSTFSPNKYLEEVEKCSTPGSVAKKAAYFEAHYKKIAAQKALLELEKKMETDPLRSDDSNCEDRSEITCGNATEFGISNGQSFPTGVEHVTDLISVENSIHVDESNEDAAITIECQSTSVEGTKEEMDSIPVLPDSPKSNRPEETLWVQEDTPRKRSQDTVEFPKMDKEKGNNLQNREENVTLGASEKSEETVLIQEDTYQNRSQDMMELPKMDKEKGDCLQNREENGELGASEKSEETVLVQEDTHLKGSQDMVELRTKSDKKKGNSLQSKEENAKVGAFKKSQKITPTKKEKNLAGSIKKAASPLPKSPKFSTPKLKKPTSTSTVMSSTQSSTKKSSNSSLTKSKNPSAGESRRIAPKSLHMSLCLGPANSDSTSLTTTRKSPIMEKMGDKDIVKRVFKSFQNNFNSTDGRSSGPEQVSTKGAEQKVSTSGTPRKENDGMRKAAEKINAERDQSGQRWHSVSLGSPKRAGVNQRNAKAVPSSFSLRSDERDEKRKEFSKKLEEKSNLKEAERTRLNSKSKGVKEAEGKVLRQSLNFKATPLRGVYQGQRTSKVALVKEGAKSEIHFRPEYHR